VEVVGGKDGDEKKEEKTDAVVEVDQEEEDEDRVFTIKETIEMLDLDGKSNKPQPDWVKTIDLQQYNGLAVVTIPGAALSEFVMLL